MWQIYYRPTTLSDVLALLQTHSANARLVAGGTDLVVELQRGIRPTTTLIDISAVAELKYVRRAGDTICLGALATHNDVIATPFGVAQALPLAQACWEVGAPQIRTRGTVAGNLVTASPANDTITALMALDAEVALASATGERVVPLSAFYLGVRRTIMRPDELLREIRFPALRDDQRGIFIKLGLRRAQAISVINTAMVITFEARTSRVKRARITLGSLAPTVVYAPEVEAFLSGKTLDTATCAVAASLACRAAAPIDDLRGSADYRLIALEGLVSQCLARIAAGAHTAGWPARPVLLETGRPSEPASVVGQPPPRTGDSGRLLPPLTMISTTINGQPYELVDAQRQTLLTLLREQVGLIGTKEGCAEGECGACTVWIDGQAIMACLTPAAQAHDATITTIEGLARGGQLHPLQQAFIEHGAVQCGYCIPGMLMSGAKLLAEQPKPTLDQIQTALSGAICRCTGYRKILDAIQSLHPPERADDDLAVLGK
ncbi:MAG: FAD binding domain-containing protein [Chloroflexales bacterium]|nr:FAD binding domain-containing protein [Chloroflexales bacterium]